jgi:hypothetical protein
VQADLTCTQCHNDTTLITGKKAAWEESLHGTGEPLSEVQCSAVAATSWALKR